MTRHARNCTAGAVYTYHEKQKDTKSCGYGTQKSRIGKDSVKDFDCCSLTLQPCRNPVITPDGYIFDKEVILEFVIHQKLEIARRKKEFEKQKKRDVEELQEVAVAEEKSRSSSFMQAQKSILHTPDHKGEASGSSISNMNAGKDKLLPSFWIPNLTPHSKKNRLQKPLSTVLCPMSGRPLKIKDLIPIEFTPVNDPDDKAALITKKNRFMCAVTHDILGNSVPSAVLKTSGKVVTMECVEKLIRPEMIDPTNGKQLKESDIIPLQRGGTGYASTNETLDAKVKRPVLQA